MDVFSAECAPSGSVPKPTKTTPVPAVDSAGNSHDGSQWNLFNRRLAPSFWLGGFLYILCAFFGWWVEYVQCINWRQPMCLPICVGYLAFYLAMLIFYWFPLALDWMPLGYIFGVIFVASTWLNATSRQPTRAAATSNELYQIYPGL